MNCIANYFLFRSGVEPDTNVFDVVVKGFDRLKFDLLGPRDSTKRFSVFYLVLPTVALHTAHFLVYKFTYDTVFGIARGYVSRKMPENRTRFHTVMPEMFASITAGLVADLVCFPLETVVHRLYIQGTRALIDNLDTGGKAINVNFKYTGTLHCVRSIIRHEGLSGFYQGVGAVVLQYSLQFCVLQALRAVFGWIDGTRKALRIKTDSPLAFRKNSSGFLMSGRSSGDPFGSSPYSDPLSGYLAGRNAEHKTSTSNLFPSFAQTQADIYSGFQPGSSGAPFTDAHSPPPPAFGSSLLQPAATAPGPSGMSNVIDTTKYEFDLRPG
ncbi:mitochondrial carrier protein domain-containing protein [Ditylenchus destructor]|uniref:Mitochondrial carrier protein domain-containing protein n=1 Tax=Ditylenchus destructor TaxID=166010 RepID=A0AAD4N4A3_9BILA|nr:mitochondrial carrier protein domain-containing protein [Ditylenchus destructor]